jgi:hypothetical protein
MTDDWPACKVEATDLEGAFTVAAAEASLVEEVPVATLQRKCCWRHQERKMTGQPAKQQPQTQRAPLQRLPMRPAAAKACAEEPGPSAAAGPEGDFTAATAAGGGTAGAGEEWRGCGEQAGPECEQDRKGVV